MKIQAKKGHYEFSKYVSKRRWTSYYHQLEETLKTGCNDILLIGLGDGLLKNMLISFGKNVTTFDFDERLEPDIVGDVTKIDEILNRKYECVICCQVLEHIPFDQFEKTIGKIQKIAKNNLILSLPDHCTYMKFNFRIIGFNEVNLVLRIPIFWQREFRIEKEGFNEHYWELCAPKINKKLVRKIINKYFNVQKEFADKDHLCHYFYICEKK